MSRAALVELPSRHPLGEMLPALYAADDFAQRFTSGLDVLLAPVISTLDNLVAYFDPVLTPEDFLYWLASWVAVELDPALPLPLRRALVARAVQAHRRRGTARGLVEWLWLCLGLHAQVHDGAGATWSRTPSTELADPPAQVVVRVWPATEALSDQVVALVAASCPAHVAFTVEVLPNPPWEDGN